MTLERINREDRLYVETCGDGYSCLGFDVLRRRHRALHAELARLGVEAPPPRKRLGTVAAWKAYQDAIEAARRFNAATGKRLEYELTPQLVGLEGKRVEVVDCYKGADPKPRRFIVGRSCGWCPCHLEVCNIRSHGGGAAWHEYKSVRVVERGRT